MGDLLHAHHIKFYLRNFDVYMKVQTNLRLEVSLLLHYTLECLEIGTEVAEALQRSVHH